LVSVECRDIRVHRRYLTVLSQVLDYPQSLKEFVCDGAETLEFVGDIRKWM